jgi:hypothetical protein
MSQPATLPPKLQAGLNSLADRLRLLRAIRGAGVVVLFLALTAAVALTADYFFDLSPLVRRGIFVSWFGVGVILVCERLCLPIWRRLDPSLLAAVVEQAYPSLHERLTTTVDLASKTDARHGAPAFIELIAKDAEKVSGKLNFQSTVGSRSAVLFSAAAGAALVMLLCPLAAWPGDYSDLVGRFLLPWSDSAPYLFSVTPGDVTAARGSSETIVVTVRSRSARIPLPAIASIVIADADGNETAQRMQVDRSDAFSFPMTVSRDGSYRIEVRSSAGAASIASATYRVTAVQPVELMPDSPSITVTPPAYARNTRDGETISGLVDLNALQGSDVHFALSFTRPAVAAHMQWAGPDTKTREYTLLLSEDGRSAELNLRATETGSYRLILEADYGVRTALEGGTLTVKPDMPPEVTKFNGREDLKAITPYERLSLDCNLADDVGVARADLEYRVNDGKPALEPFVLSGAGRLEAKGELLFALEGKVKEGDTISYRLRVEDNYPKEFKGPHVAYAPADRWLTLKIARQTGPAREQDIAANRDAIDRRIEDIRQALMQEMRGLYKLKLESRLDPALSPEQRDALSNLQQQNQATEKSLRQMAAESQANTALQPLAEKARNIADRQMQQSDSALRSAGTARMPAMERDSQLKAADEHLSDALLKLDDLKKHNEQVAKDRADQLRFEELAEKQQKLAEKAAELAKKEAAGDPSAKEQADKLQREQAQTAEELQRLADQSPQMRQALDRALAEQAKRAAERARELAEAERSLAKAKADADTDQKISKLADLAEKQRAFAERAARFAEESKQSARTARVQPVRPEDARRATDALKDGDAKDAMNRQEILARNLDRLADGLDRATAATRDPRDAARQLAKLQDDLRQRVQDEMYRKNSDKPLAERLAELSKEQEAIRKAAEALSLPPDGDAARKDRQAAVEEATRAADQLRHEDARPSLGSMERARRALESLGDRLPTLSERQVQAGLDVSRMRRDQDDIARQVEQVARDSKEKDSAKGSDNVKQKLGDIARRQADLLKDLEKIDPSTREARRARAAAAVKQALADLQKGLPEDASASQKDALRELERLEQAIAGRKPADEQALELARRQKDLADEASRIDKPTTRQKAEIARKQQNIANEANGLSAPEAPERQAEAARAARAAAKEASTDPTGPPTRQAMQEAARKLDELAKQMNGLESDAARADRLARRQAKIADDAEKQLKANPDKTQPLDMRQSENEIAREAEQLRGGEDGRTAKRTAERALDESQKASQPQDQVTAQKKAAASLRELADRIAGREDDAKPGDAPQMARPDADDGNATPRGMPSRQQSEQARQLAGEQRALRDAVRKAAEERPAPTPANAGNDPLADLAKKQSEIARQSKELSRDVAREHGDQSPASRQSDNANHTAQQAADSMQVGDLPAARQAGKQAAGRFRQLADELAHTPAGDNPETDKALLRRSRDLALQQEEINKAATDQKSDPDSRHARQQARQEDLRRQAGELEKELSRMSQDMTSRPQAGEAADQAAKAAREAQQQMDKSSKNPSQAGRSQEQAARALERSAQQADRAASEQSAAADGAGQEKAGAAQAGQSVSQARSQMEKAQGQLGEGKAQQAQQSMEKAARSLRQAAAQMARTGQPDSNNNPDSANSLGPTPTAGKTDLSVLGPGVAKYAGKSWGELPGELRTKIVQDMKVKYGEDYARMIKLYFEQLADTKRDVK